MSARLCMIDSRIKSNALSVVNGCGRDDLRRVLFLSLRPQPEPPATRGSTRYSPIRLNAIAFKIWGSADLLWLEIKKDGVQVITIRYQDQDDRLAN